MILSLFFVSDNEGTCIMNKYYIKEVGWFECNRSSLFLYMICLAIYYHLARKSYNLPLKLDYYALSQYRDIYLKDI